MGRSRSPGLRRRGRIWHIEKQVRGIGRLCESTGTIELEEAQRYLAKRMEDIRQATVYEVRPKRSFREAATKYLLEHQHKASIACDGLFFRQLDAYIGTCGSIRCTTARSGALWRTGSETAGRPRPSTWR